MFENEAVSFDAAHNPVIDPTVIKSPFVAELKACFNIVKDYRNRDVSQLSDEERRGIDEEESTSWAQYEATALTLRGKFMEPESRTDAVHRYADLRSRISMEAKERYAAVHTIMSGSNHSQRLKLYVENQYSISEPVDRKALGHQALSFAYAYHLLNRHQQGARMEYRDPERVARVVGTPYEPGNKLTRSRRLKDHFNAVFDDIDSVKETLGEPTIVLKAEADLAHQLKSLDRFNRGSGILGLVATDALQSVNGGIIDTKFRKNFVNVANEGRKQITQYIKTGRIESEKSEKHFEDVVSLGESFMESVMYGRLSKEDKETFDSSFATYAEDKLSSLADFSPDPKIVYTPPRPETPEYPEQPDKDVVSPSEEHTDAEAAARESQIETMSAELAILDASLAELRQPFNPSVRTLKQSQLAKINYDLITGYADEEVGLLLNGISKADAQRMTGLLHGMLHFLPTDQQERNAAIEVLLVSEEDLVAQITESRRELNALGKNGFSTLSNDLAERYSWLSANHLALTAIINGELDTKSAEPYMRLLAEVFNTQAAPEIESEEPEEIPLDEPDLELTIPLEEQEVARQLDWEVFPSDIGLKGIIEIAGNSYTSTELDKVEWGRIADLLKITQKFEGTLYRAKPQSLGVREPYFVADVIINGKQFVIAENPQYGNATYVLRADRAYDGMDWKRVFEQSRKVAREVLGAERIIHSKQRSHLARIMDNIQSQLLVKVDLPQ